MPKKVIFCADIRYPHGDAGANRVHYFAKALIEAGINVEILARPANADYLSGIYDGIKYRNITLSGNKHLKYLQEKLFSGKYVRQLLKNCEQFSCDDCVFLYGSNSLFLLPILHFTQKHKIKSVLDVVEWHQPEQAIYKFGKWDPRYLSSNYSFNQLTKKADKLITVTKYLADHFKDIGLQTEYFPVMTDTEVEKTTLKTNGEELHLIYPGSPMGKEDLVVMLKGIANLPNEARKKILFHFTGVEETDIYNALGEGNQLINDLKDSLCFHGKVSFEKLQKIYQEADFLYFSRPDNIVNRANFPSKIPELMAMGIPPVCVKVGEYPDYLCDGTDSILFNGNTVEDASDALIRAVNMTSDEKIQMRKNAMNTAKVKFDYRLYSERLSEYLFQ